MRPGQDIVYPDGGGLVVMRPLAMALLALPLASRAAEPHPRFLEMVEPLGSVGTVRPRHRPESQRLPHWARGLRGGGAPPAAAPSRVLRPAAFGADPTGKADSAAAFDRLLAAAWSAPVGRFTNGPDTAAVVDLEGGVYTLSRPLVFPAAGGGGLAMRDGVLRATPDFPMGAESALLLLTSTNGTNADGLCCCEHSQPPSRTSLPLTSSRQGTSTSTLPTSCWTRACAPAAPASTRLRGSSLMRCSSLASAPLACASTSVYHQRGVCSGRW